MKNFIAPGKAIDHTVPSSVSIASGDVVQVVDIIGIASTDGEEGDTIALALEGIFEVPKVTTDTIDKGQKVYWDDTAKKMTETEGSPALPFAGYATEAAGNGVTTVKVLLAR